MVKTIARHRTGFVLWVLFFSFSVFAAVSFQKVLLPLLPGLHGGHGLIGGGDSVLFHRIAADLAEAIHLHGWGRLTLTPSQGVTGNVSLLAALYVVFGPDPSVMVPINAAVHATSGLFIFLIARLLWRDRVGTLSGIIAASLFVVFPSALNWYGQIHKDGFSILGMLIILYSWVQVRGPSSRLRSALWMGFGNVLGLILVVFVRPYNVMLLLLSGFVLSFALFVYCIVARKGKKVLYFVALFALFAIELGVVNTFAQRLWVVEKKDMLLREAEAKGISWQWKADRLVPRALDRIIENAAAVRVVNIYYGREVRAGSLIDEDIMPDSIRSSLAYLPRALSIALFAPFPDAWLSKRGLIHLVSAGETALWYLMVPGVCLAFGYRRSLPVFLLALNALVFLTVLGFTTPNMGTLYRFRYLYLFILILIGTAGWTEFIFRRFRWRVDFAGRESPGPVAGDTAREQAGASPVVPARSMVATAGLAVVFFTLVSSMLLVVRDVLLARWFGLGNELDAFFVALIVPMFLVTVMSMPIGTVMVPSLLGVFEGGREKAQELIRACSTVILCGMTALCLIVFVSAGSYLPLVGWGFPAAKISQSRYILMMVLPLLFFSGFVILGNSILNARQRFALPALAQAAVPVVAILTLYLLAGWIGIYAMAIGTCLGQVVNLLVVCLYVRREGFSMLPELRPGAIRETLRRSSERLKGLLSQYAPLVFSSIFVSVALPVNNAIAASLSAGSVSAFNLGTKFIVFFTGLISTGVSTVMLPYFASYFVSNRIVDARRELSLFLFLGTVVPIPLTLIVFFFTGSIVKLMFGGGAFTVADTFTVTAVIEYGMVQLPFFCTNMLFSRFANARQKNALIMISSLAGLILNIVLNFVFIRYMGLAGISLAVSVSMIGATVLFVVVGRRYNDITWIDVAFLGSAWFLYLTILLCYHFGSMLNVIVTSAVLLLVILDRLVGLRGNRPASTDIALRC